MEGARHRRSTSTSSFEGHSPDYQFQKHSAVGRSSPDSRSYANASTSKNALLEGRPSSSGRAADRPLANLPSEKSSSKETEPKRRILRGFARLLRREGLPSLWSSNKQKKKLLDSYRQKHTSTNIESDRELSDGQSNRRSPKKPEETNDVYEDLEASSVVSGRCSSRWSPSSMLSKSEMALIRQNLETKRLTYEETISEKFHESGDLDVTSRDIMMRFGRNKNSYENPVYDPRGASSSSLGSPPALLNLPSPVKCGNAKSRGADGDVTGKDDITYHPNRDDGLLLDPEYRRRARTAHKMSDVQSKGKNKKCTPPTHILVLKPDQGKMKNGHGSSQNNFPSSSTMTAQPSAGSVKELSWKKTKSYYDAEFSDPASEEARRLAKKITRQLRDACEKNEDGRYSGIREYLTDPSLYGATESAIDNDLDMLKCSSRSSFVDGEGGSRASSRSVNEEAKKRLAERWKITRKYQDLEIVGSSSTLGEMLSTSDGERRSRKTAYVHTDRSSKKAGSDHGSSIPNGLSGTFSRGGSKNKTERTSRSRSVPPMSGSSRGRGTFHNEKPLLHSDPVSHGTSKVTKKCPSHKDHFTTQASKSKGKKPLLCPPIFIEEIDSSLEARFEIEMEANVKVLKDLPCQQLTFRMEEKDDSSGGDVSETVAAEHGITTQLSKASLLHPSDSPVDNESSSSNAHDQKDFCLQEVVSEETDPAANHLGAEPISSDRSKDVDYASPASVPETPFIEEASSSSENCERVSPELDDLRMQLQLLKMEDAYDKRSTHNPFGEGWEASYTLDLLIQAGLHEFGFDLFMIMWHCPECPLDLRLFDILEEKYQNEIAGTRQDRMLLFDRINSAISAIFMKHVDVCPWEMSELRGSLHLTWQKERARRAVETLIAQESANPTQATERVLDRDVQWSDPREEVALTGTKISELLINDLINELLFD